MTTWSTGQPAPSSAVPPASRCAEKAVALRITAGRSARELGLDEGGALLVLERADEERGDGEAALLKRGGERIDRRRVAGEQRVER